MKTHMTVVVDKLWQQGFLKGIHEGCVFCHSDLDSCVVLKECVQSLMNHEVCSFLDHGSWKKSLSLSQ